MVVLAVPKLYGYVYGNTVRRSKAKKGASLLVAETELNVSQHEINDDAMNGPHEKFVKVMAVREPIS